MTSSPTARAIAEVIPLVGFYLQPAVGGRVLPSRFWRRFAEIENVVAIKIAPFNRYQTLDVVRGVAEPAPPTDIALYTGNDDHIVLDLLTPFRITATGRAPHAADHRRACSGTGRSGHARSSNCCANAIAATPRAGSQPNCWARGTG